MVEILNGNKIPEAGNTLICAIANVLANYTIKECEGFAKPHLTCYFICYGINT